MTEREDTIKRIEIVLKLTHKESITVTIPRLAAERAVSLLKEQEAVVRCKDCKHRPTYPAAYGAEINGKWCYWCELHRAWKHDNWYCADGERKEGR